MDEISSDQLTPEQRFELFLEFATDYAIFFFDRRGIIVEWSKGAEQVIGLTEREALQQDSRIIFTEEDRAAGIPEREMERAEKAGQANDERWHLRADGSRFFAVGRLIALKSENGYVYGFAKIIRDATPYKSLEEALKLSEEQYHLTFTQAPLGMVVIDLQGRIIQANVAFCQLAGYDEE